MGGLQEAGRILRVHIGCAGGIRYLGGTVETYGNINTADSLTVIKEIIYDKKLRTPGQIQKVNLHSYLVVIINNSANTTLRKVTAASADGRGRGAHMANANNPWVGNEKRFDSNVKFTGETPTGYSCGSSSDGDIESYSLLI